MGELHLLGHCTIIVLIAIKATARFRVHELDRTMCVAIAPYVVCVLSGHKHKLSCFFG